MTQEPEPAGALNVLVVERSALVRVAMVDILTRVGGFQVFSVSDPRLAFTRSRQLRPDVILLGLASGGADALAFLHALMAEEPIPVVVFAEREDNGPDLALRALDEGAMEIVAPPKPGTTTAVGEPALRLVETVRAAAAAQPSAFGPPGRREEATAMQPALASPMSARLVAIGAGTGGTQALRALLRAMPPASPGFVIVQHLPAGFTAPFAAQLDRECRIDVKEARSGDRVCPGSALIAPGDRHLVVTGGPGRHTVEVVDRPPLGRDRPSADLLFRSVAECARDHAIGVVLTGAGEDGAAGILEMERVGAVTLAQDPATCVDPGMPQSAIRWRSVEEVVPLSCLAARILSRGLISRPRFRTALMLSSTATLGCRRRWWTAGRTPESQKALDLYPFHGVGSRTACGTTAPARLGRGWSCNLRNLLQEGGGSCGGIWPRSMRCCADFLIATRTRSPLRNAWPLSIMNAVAPWAEDS